jgi:hypothetical protein
MKPDAIKYDKIAIIATITRSQFSISGSKLRKIKINMKSDINVEVKATCSDSR